MLHTAEYVAKVSEQAGQRSLIAPSPIGGLKLTSDGEALTGLWFMGTQAGPPKEKPDAILKSAIEELEAYFARRLTRFETPVRPSRGTDFQRKVWAALRDIPYGVTRSYADIARSIGQPTASRAVGAANGANPISIIVPCHRVIGAKGALVGFGGGLHSKRRLLELEGVFLPLS
ncbi:MAG: methylated-DNA--[protein]-cysteine S-methyltransferase [Caulobacterales bacterium]